MSMLRLLLAATIVACSSPARPPPGDPGPRAAVPPPAPAVPELPAHAQEPVDDPYLWLEDVTSDRALEWARERNHQSQGELEKVAQFAETRDRIRAILDSKDKLPYVTKRGSRYYNFWTDEKNKRGLLRRTTLGEFKKRQPKWETVLDIDALGAAEDENWVFKGMTCVYPTEDRCLVSLSRGGADATVVRELDTRTKAFVAGGFELPEAKSRVAWIDRDTVYVGTDFGPGTMTTSGYPRQVKEWKRGTPLAEAQLVYEGEDTDLGVSAARSWDHGEAYDLVHRRTSFFAGEHYLRGAGGTLTKLAIPTDALPSVWNGQLLVELRTDWTVDGKTWPRGSLVATPLAEFVTGKGAFTALFEPAPNKSFAGFSGLKTAIVTNELEDVKSRLYTWKLAKGKWTKKPFPTSKVGTTRVWAVENDGRSDELWMVHSDYLTPQTLSLGVLGKRPAPLKKSPAFFDAKGLHVEQHFTTSADGTRVPYFQVSRKSLALDASAPTILYGYGGFEVSMTPGYSATSGAAWLERGGVYVVANIRGGGEYGPAWHQAALRHNRQRAYDDFIAIAEDLIARKVTSPQRLGIIGGSNGGLLTSVMLTQRPDLFGAIVSAVPLADMKRYHKLLAGASWMEEYGDPDDPEDWAALAKYSPYHNLKPDATYPRVLFTSSTRDDRVHPAHARKMVARMLEYGHDVLYYENLEGGHGGAADNEQAAFMQALQYAFFAKQLGLP
jgi:prolyl oligopeptidase